jgi:hypothetical protein
MKTELNIRRLIKIFLVIPFRIVLKNFGYYNKPSNVVFPKSYYYKVDTVYDFFSGLHKIPSNKAWLESKVNNISIKNGELIPWITYPALCFLDRLNLSEKNVVEFGSGASTAYLVRRGARITSFEFDTEYYSSIEPLIRNPNLQIVDATKFEYLIDSEPICDLIVKLIENDRNHADLGEEFWGKFEIPAAFKVFSHAIDGADLVFIDGGPRSFAIGIAAARMKPNAILIIDNSDIRYIRDCFASLHSAGFVEIPFFGLGPLNPYEWKTSVFIKSIDSLK